VNEASDAEGPPPCTPPPSLFPADRLRHAERVNLVRFLGERAKAAAPRDQAVAHRAARDVLLKTDLAARHHTSDAAGDRDEGNKAAE